MLFTIALTILFIAPAFYRLRAKGYPALPFIVVTIILSVSAPFSGAPMALAITPLAPIALFILSLFLPKREGAPGKNYLHIIFNCPECDESITFPRDQEGRAILCPKCDKLITVPSESSIMEPHYKGVAQDKNSGDFVTISRFLNSEQADLASQQLESAGISTLLPDSATCHIYPGVGWAGGGSRLMVASTDLDDALAILNIPKSEICLPTDFTPPPAPPEPEYNNRLFFAFLYSILFLFIFPPILVQIWSCCIVPVFFDEAVREGIIAESISMAVAIKITACISLAFVVVAFVKEREFQATLRKKQQDSKEKNDN